MPSSSAAPDASPPRLDGRSRRRTHRTVSLATKVTPEFDQELRAIADRDGLLLVEVLEQAVRAYERERARSGA